MPSLSFLMCMTPDSDRRPKMHLTQKKTSPTSNDGATCLKCSYLIDPTVRTGVPSPVNKSITMKQRREARPPTPFSTNRISGLVLQAKFRTSCLDVLRSKQIQESQGEGSQMAPSWSRQSERSLANSLPFPLRFLAWLAPGCVALFPLILPALCYLLRAVLPHSNVLLYHTSAPCLNARGKAASHGKGDRS